MDGFPSTTGSHLLQPSATDPPPAPRGQNEPPQPKNQSIDFISLLRGFASLLVVWDHLVGSWNDENGRRFAPLDWSRQFITQPLVIIQDFGYLGVVLFFFVSGFIITHVGRREGQLAFFVKRFLRIYPPLVVSILVIVAIALIQWCTQGGEYLFTGYHPGDYLRAMTLWNYFCIPQNPVCGVAWTLVIEVLFYLLCLIMLPLLKALPVIASATMTLFCAAVLYRSHDLGDRFFLFGDVCGHLPLLLIGQATYLLWAKLARPWQCALLAAGNYLVFVYSLKQVHTDFFPATNSYGVSTVYAYLLFVIVMMLAPRVPKVIAFYARISYSLYLFHGVIGLTMLDLLVPRMGYPLSLLVAIVSVTLWSYLSWRWVEQPSQNAARRVLKRFGGESTAAAPMSVVYWLFRWCVALIAPLGLAAFGIWLALPLTHGWDASPVVASIATTQPEPDATPPVVSAIDAIDGSLDIIDSDGIAGWCWDSQHPHARVQVAIFIDGQLAGTVVANVFRDDIQAACNGDGKHAFVLPAPPLLQDGKSHLVSAREASTQKELAGSPRKSGA